MSVWEILAIILAGLAAGTINTIVGSGTLVTFPTLLFFGYPPVSANISNSLGLVPGGLAGAWGYRHELRSLGPMVARLAPASFAGAVIGALLLLVLPAAAFEAIVPILIGDGISFFEGLDTDVALHLMEVKAYDNGMVALRHQVVKNRA